MIKKNNIAPPGSIAAVIDMGSNSFHMVIARYSLYGYRIIERFMRNVRLAEDFSNESVLSEQAIARGLSCVHEFNQYLIDSPVDIVWPVATNTLRNAKNKHIFIEQAEEILQHKIDIIAGKEEARLIYLGSVNTHADNFCCKRLVVDIGGGSTEYIVGESYKTEILKSLQLGCVVFKDKYFNENLLTEESFEAAYNSARTSLSSIEKEIANSGWINAFGSSGTIRSIYNAIRVPGSRSYIHYTDLINIKKRILKYSNVNDINVRKLPYKKRNAFPAGLAILLATFDALNISNMQFSDGALREGMLYEMYMNNKQIDVTERTIRELEEQYQINTSYSAAIVKTVGYCFSQAKDCWGLTSENLFLLQAAARLCKIGIHISYMNYHHHSLYIINNTNLSGFSAKQKKHLIILIRSHIYSISRSIISSVANDSETQNLSYLILLLRIAYILTHGRINKNLFDYSFSFTKYSITFNCNEDWKNNNPINYRSLLEETKLLKKTPYSLDIIENK